MATDTEFAEQAAWLQGFVVAHQATLQKFLIENRSGLEGRILGPHCAGIAQLATLKAGGRLRYHEGEAKNRFTSESLKHAWNTFNGAIVDFDCVYGYTNHNPKVSYSFEQVLAVWNERKGAINFIYDPDLAKHPECWMRLDWSAVEKWLKE